MTTPQWLLLALIQLAVPAVVLGAWVLWRRQHRLRERLARIDAGGQRLGARTPDEETAGVDAEALGTLARWAEPVARLSGAEDVRDAGRVRARFLQAGWRSRAAPLHFFALKSVLALAGPLLAWLALTAAGHGASRLGTQAWLLLLVGSAAAGLYLPNALLRLRIERRQQELFEAFPDAIDLMIVCMESGLSLDLAIQRADQEMTLRSPALAEELALVGMELRIGATRERALRNLALRTGVPEVGAFVASLLQAERFGTTVADALRVHAEDLRLRRQYRAEEAAAKVPTKLLFPLILTIFPALLVVLVGPAGIGLVRQVLPLLGGGASP